MVIGVVLAGGISQRFQSIVHKQYLKLNGKEILSYSIKKMRECPEIDRVILVVDEEEFDSHYIENKYNIECVCGGETRNESVKNVLDYINSNYNCDVVVFHDAVRPFVESKFISKTIKALTGYDCVVSYQELVDSLYSDKLGFVDRNSYKLIQTPEVLKFKALYDIFDKDKKTTVISAQLVNPKINYVKSDEFGFKITYPKDLFLAEQLDRINYYKQSEKKEDVVLKNKNVLIFGGFGGLGSEINNRLNTFKNITIKNPSIEDLDLENITVDDILKYCGDFKPDIVINAAAISLSDSDGIVETFDKVMSINLKSNLVMFDYMKTLNKKCKFIAISSSSSTKGRENITNYSASKCGLNSIIESNAEKLYKENILINAIIPEKINTPMI